MAALIKKVGHVEIWRDEYLDAKLKTETANALKNPKTVFNSNKEREQYSISYLEPMKKLEQAIHDAPAMAQVAVDRLTSLIGSPGTDAFLGSTAQRELKLDNTVAALFKYFLVPLDLRQQQAGHAGWQTVEQISVVFERTLEGLRKPYRIYLYETQNTGESQTALGFVRHPKVAVGQAPLDIYFRTPADPSGHVPHPHWLETGHIHLRMNALQGKDSTRGSVARLLLHEATHKWANTEDICYKWGTFAQKQKHKEWDRAKGERSFKARELDRAIESKMQPSAARPGKVKPLLAMAKTGVSGDRWVLNADSYAYVGYRLWKEETVKGALDYAVWDD